jgi:hypothetical protein
MLRFNALAVARNWLLAGALHYTTELAYISNQAQGNIDMVVSLMAFILSSWDKMTTSSKLDQIVDSEKLNDLKRGLLTTPISCHGK